MKVFLDLEQTVINSWHDHTLINGRKIKFALKHLGVSSVSIFSFAIDDDKDMQKFNDELKGIIEQYLDVTIDDVVTSEDVFKMYHQKGVKFDHLYEMKQMFGKSKSFIDWCTSRNENMGQHFILIDDACGSIFFCQKNLDITVEILDVNRLVSEL
jgi:hypothetical protein